MPTALYVVSENNECKSSYASFIGSWGCSDYVSEISYLYVTSLFGSIIMTCICESETMNISSKEFK